MNSHHHTSHRIARHVVGAALSAAVLAGAQPAGALGCAAWTCGPWWRGIATLCAGDCNYICPGDCNADGAVTIDEVLRGVAIAHSDQPTTACPAIDEASDGAVDIVDLIVALRNGLDGCPPARFRLTTCSSDLPVPEGQEGSISCGELMAPESRAAHDGRIVRLPTVILHANGSDPASRQADPFVFLTGGPGSAALDGVYLPSLTADFLAPIQAARDVVIFDQRGTGRARPSLDCPEVPARHLGFAEALTPAEEAARELDGARACATRLVGSGVDLSAYDSAAAAQDIADLMSVLGYPRANLYGLSYGSRVALTALRDLGGERIRSAVLDGAVPPQVHLVTGEAAAALQTALRRVFADCAATPSCAAAYPDLEADTFALIERLNAEPLTLSPTGPGGQPFTVVLTGDRLVSLLFLGLQSNALIPFVPLLIDNVTNGDTFLLTIAVGALAEPDRIAVGLAHAVLCNEETPFNTPEVIAAAERGVDPRLVTALAADPRGAVCPWDGATADPVENEAVVSDVPALILSGGYDPSTPPAWGETAAAGLSRATHIELRGFGHGALGQAPSTAAAPSCAMQLIAAFIADPTQPVDRTCVDALPAPAFLGG